MTLVGPVGFLVDGSISQDDDGRSFGEDFEAGTKRLPSRVERLLREGLMERAGRVLVWSSCRTAGSLLTCSPKTRTLDSRLQERPPLTAVGFCRPEGWQKECSRRGEGMLCKSFLAKGRGMGCRCVGKKYENGVKKRSRLARRRAELQRGEDLLAGFPKEMLNCMFLFLITKQYLLTTERTETTDKQKAKTSKQKES